MAVCLIAVIAIDTLVFRPARNLPRVGVMPTKQVVIVHDHGEIRIEMRGRVERTRK
jgi:hypothetical protein